MPRQFNERYSASTFGGLLNSGAWDRVISDLDARLAATEDFAPELNSAIETFVSQGLARIDTELNPAFSKLRDVIALGFLQAESSTLTTLAQGTTVMWVVDAGAQRDLFTPGPYCTISRQNSATEYAFVRTILYDAEHGEYTAEVLYVGGATGAHNDWVISAGTALPLLVDAAVDATQLARTQAVDAALGTAADAIAIEADRAEVAANRSAVAVDTASVVAARDLVEADRAEVAAALALIGVGPVASINGKTGIVNLDPTLTSNVQPSLDLHLTSPDAIQSSWFTRASVGYRRRVSGLYESVSAASLRTDHSLSGASLGTLIEAAVTNLATYSEEFDNAVWSKANGLTVTPNAATAPDGTLTADRFVPGNGQISYMFRSLSVTAGSIYNLSLHAKASELSSFNILVDPTAFASGSNRYVTFDLVAKTATAFGAVAGDVSGHIIELKDGWFRCILTFTAGVTATINPQVFRSIAAGDGTSGILAWGAQIATGAWSSYMPAGAATATRAADVLLIPTSSEWYNPEAGTIYAEGTLLARPPNNFASVFAIGDATYANRITVIIGATGTPSLVLVTANTSQTLSALSQLSAGSSFRLAASWDGSGRSMSLNGAAVVTSSVAQAIPAVTQMTAGYDGVGFNYFNGPIKRLGYCPRRLSDTDLMRMAA